MCERGSKRISLKEFAIICHSLCLCTDMYCCVLIVVVSILATLSACFVIYVG